MRWGRARPRGRLGVSAVIATILMLGLTVTSGVILWTFRPTLPADPFSVQYFAQGNQHEPAWSDPTDCHNWSIPDQATCNPLPAIFIIVTSHTPDSIPLNQLEFTFFCNGTSLLNGTFKSMEIIPGTGTNPGPGAPHIHNCGSWSWGSGHGTTGTFFNRLAYFQQIQTGATVLRNGDLFVVYIHPLANFCDVAGYGCSGGTDDDFHGAPLWCFTVPGACNIQLSYIGHPQTLIGTISLTQLQG